MTWLADSVYSIREAATNNLKQLTNIFGVKWAEINLFPKVFALKDNTNYLYRMTTLFAISTLAPCVPPEVIVEKMLPVCLAMSKDPVPNIRFNVAKTLETIVEFVDPKVIQEQIKPCLNALQEDRDTDVKFFATQALSRCT
jgi:serine/threonine-protein phosphatase 2A regulatory subunit A